MGSDFPYFDVVFFALIAGFLIYRLHSVLGKRTGHERQRHQEVVSNREATAPQPADAPEPIEDETALGQNLNRIQAVDRSFSPDAFVAGARQAFTMIVQAYADGDRDALRPLLADEVYDAFAAAITEREQAGQTQETDIVDLRTADISDARLEGRIALVTVTFVSEQTNVTRDADGQVVDGNPNDTDMVTDVWTFGRDTRSSDPNWQLMTTEAPE